jgi:DNA primase
MIPESFIQDLVARIDIVDLVDSMVPLKKAGANYVACCPFHSEKTPSFTVSPSKQFYHCFGCGAHGTSIGFLMQFSGLDFVEAVKELANRAGVQVPEESVRRDAPRSGPDLRELTSRAARFFREQLKQSPQAIAYLKSRGLTGEVAARFGIGYAPDEWQGLEKVFDHYDDPVLQTAGLVIKNEQGRLYDRFRDRIMFPIQNPQGDVIGFGGRVLGEGEPKYLNSPETPLFEKGRELFGLPQARAALRERDTAIVVEGYMDVVALSQHGVGNAVATLGTATTPTHVQKLLRQVDRIVFCFDGDNAGRKAAWRALENALESAADNKSMGFAFLPPEHDPDSLIREQGAAAFNAFIDGATPLSEYLVQELARRTPPGTAEDRSRLVQEARPLLLKLKAQGLRLQIVKRLAEITNFAPAEVERLCELKSLAVPVRHEEVRRRAPRRAPSLARKIGLILLGRPALALDIDAGSLPGTGDEGAGLALLHAAIREMPGNPESASIAALLERLRNTERNPWIEQLAGEWLASPLSDEDIDAEWSDLRQSFRHRNVDAEIAELTRAARHGPLDEAQKQRLVALLRQRSAPRESAG